MKLKFNKLVNKFKSLFYNCKDKIFTNKSRYLRIQQNLLSEAINQTLKEINCFDYDRWKEKYGDDMFYFLFEQQFRGKSSDIKDRQSIYINYVKQAHLNNQDKIWLDIGCGRGEFIELLKELNIPCVGIDINSVNIDICKMKGLNVVREDAIKYLSSVKDKYFSGISAFHVVEHLSRQNLYEFVRLCFCKLAYKGILIFETVNIRNNVASKNYFIDPTHNLPLMPEFLSMFLEFVGFKEVFVLYLTHSYDGKQELNDTAIYPDYAVVATK
ncbi:MAG: class I SAM-dependent methyltransferase [Endomicrobia bacterium]|nr:class I SAM-dependent methyltransferase [Endomicrobiia bacterium]